tara:strand:- start:408 stop:1223 length:816 start_codon:yes stop_codon:yes gene_type:complete
MRAQTSCKGCVFAIEKEEQQAGCELYRSEKLGICDTEDGGYVLQRFCNTYRPEEWLSELSLEQYKKRHQVALKEVVPRIGFLIILDTSKDTAEKLVAMKNLEKTIKDIKNQTLHQARYLMVVTDKTEYNTEIQEMLVNEFDHEKTLHHLIKVSEMPENKMFLVDECFRHAKNGWIYTTTSGESIDEELIEKINQRINVDMKRLSVVKPYDDFNGLLFSTPLFKMLNGNHKKAYETNDGELEFDGRPFLEKVEDMKDDTGETLITWEEFNAS